MEIFLLLSNRFDNFLIDFGRVRTLDSSSGVFKAPSAGVYMFTVSGIASTLYTKIYLVLNGSKSSCSHAEIKYGTFAMQQLLNLNSGDRVSVFLERGGVGATDDIYNHFTGIQLQ